MAWEDIIRKILPNWFLNDAGEQYTATEVSPDITKSAPTDPNDFYDTTGHAESPGVHGGVDINYQGTNRAFYNHAGKAIVCSPVSGDVIYARTTSSGLKIVVIKDSNGLFHRLLHLNDINIEEGAIVTAGQRIGTQGNSGTQAVHVHYDIQIPQNSQNPLDSGNIKIDPVQYWNDGGIKLTLKPRNSRGGIEVNEGQIAGFDVCINVGHNKDMKLKIKMGAGSDQTLSLVGANAQGELEVTLAASKGTYNRNLSTIIQVSAAHDIGILDNFGKIEIYAVDSNGVEIPISGLSKNVGIKAIDDDNILDVLKKGLDKIISEVYSLYGSAEAAAPPPSCPIVLDLDGDGVETTSVNAGGYFDYDGNSFAEQTGGVAPDDGMLVRDINGNGTIDNGKELFGNETILNDGTKAANGFDALTELDDNLDGKIDANDAAWNQLMVWKDTDGNGDETGDELHTLDELGIQSINTGYVESTTVDAQGNEHRQIGSFTKTDGTTGTAADVWFKTDKTFTIANEWLDVPADIAALPDLQAYGNVHDLQQAIVRDTSGQLKSLVEQFISSNDTTIRNSLMEQILFKWTESDTIDPASRGSNIDARKLVVLEKFYGEAFVGTNGANPNVNAAPLLNQSYSGLYEMFYAQMMAQTHLKPLYDTITYTWDEATQSIKGDLSVVAVELQNKISNDYTTGKTALSEFVRTIVGFQSLDMMNYQTMHDTFAPINEELGWIVDSAGKNIISGSAGNDYLQGTANVDAIRGGDGNDTLRASNNTGYDVLYGNSGADILYGWDRNNTLDGGTGNDRLEGGYGSDTYIFRLGSGQDTIYEYYTNPGDIDTVEFGEGITGADLELIKESNNLRINIKNMVDSLLIQNWFSSDIYKIEQFKFADGTLLTLSDLNAMGYQVYGTVNNDYLNGTNANDTMYGYEGNDTMYGSLGNDILDGNTGNDYLQGDSGNDTLRGAEGNDSVNGGYGNDILDGGLGDDYLSGDVGNDTYKFGLGSGVDTISDYDTTIGNIDTVEFGEGILKDNLILLKEGNNLRINIKDSTDSLGIKDWFWGDVCKIEQFKFTDGTVLTSSDIDAIGYKVYGTSGDNYLNGTSAKDEIYGYEGNDNLSGGEGNDVLDGGSGNDIIGGSLGNDILDGGAGNDTLYGDAGNDTYKFGLGSGQDTILDNDSTAGNTDTVEFGAGISSSDLELIKEGSHLRINIKNTTDSLVIQKWFDSDTYKVEQFKFADGSVMSASDLHAMGYKVYGTAGNEDIYGSDSNDEIYGNAGNDGLVGLYGNDKLYGGEGDDRLYGNGGDDILDGGTGNDYMEGFDGNDIYKFGLGSGQDTIYNYDTAGVETIGFGEGIASGNLDLIKEGNNLKISIKGTTDSLTVQNWFGGDLYEVENLKFADGSVLTPADLGAMGYKVYGTSGNDYVEGSNANEIIYGFEGNDSLWGYGGDDKLYGGTGSDTLAGNDGNDTLSGNEGVDMLYGDQGNDVLDGGTGDDTLSGYEGSDIYKFGIGSGQDTISEYDSTNTATDIVEFGEGITVANLELVKEAYNWRIKVNSSDSLLIQNGLSIEQFKFANGSVLNTSEITYGTASRETINGTTNRDVIYGDDGDDKIYGKTGDDILYGGRGIDYIYGEDGNDTLWGGANADKLYGGNGNDILNGGTANDFLQGDYGNDTYKFSLGSGQDTINDYSKDAATTTDTVEIEVNPLDLIFSKSSKNLVVSLNGTTDKATIQNWYSGSTYQTEVFEASDGSRLLNTKVEQLIQAMATFSTDNGMSWSDAIQQKPQEVQAVLAQYWEPQR